MNRPLSGTLMDPLIHLIAAESSTAAESSALLDGPFGGRDAGHVPRLLCCGAVNTAQPKAGGVRWAAGQKNHKRRALTHPEKRRAASLQSRPGGIRDSRSREASQAAGAAPTLRYGPAGDSAPRLRLKASGMAERFPFGASAARSLTTSPIHPLSPREQRRPSGSCVLPRIPGSFALPREIHESPAWPSLIV